MATNNSALLRWANIIAFVLTVIINGLAGSTTLIGGVNTAFISDSNPTLITPAGFTHSNHSKRRSRRSLSKLGRLRNKP